MATGAEPASYQWSWLGGNAKASGGITAYYGVDNSAPIDAQNGQANGASTTNIGFPSINTATANTRLIAFAGSTSSPTTDVTPNAGMTERYEDASVSGTSTRNEAADEVRAAIGATGTRTATTDGRSARRSGSSSR